MNMEKSQNKELSDADKETLRFTISQDWTDIHQMRNQNWTALGVIAGIHYALWPIYQFLYEKNTIVFNVIVKVLICLLLMSFVMGSTLLGRNLLLRHEKIWKFKIQWILEAQKKLGLVQGGSIKSAIAFLPHDLVIYSKNFEKSKNLSGIEKPEKKTVSFYIDGFYRGLLAMYRIGLALEYISKSLKDSIMEKYARTNNKNLSIILDKAKKGKTIEYWKEGKSEDLSRTDFDVLVSQAQGSKKQSKIQV